MERTKLKTIIILILLLLNLFLLVLVVGRERQQVTAEEALQESTIQYLSDQGIQVNKESIPWKMQGKTYITERDQGEERRVAEGLLGSVESRGMSLATEYQGEGGLARFYPDGRFFIRFAEGVPPTTEDLVYHSSNFLKKFMGLNITFVESNQVGEASSLRFLQMVEDLPVFTCEIQMNYVDGALQSLQGWRILENPREDPRRQKAFDAATLLLRFVSQLEEEGEHCNSIDGITQGYIYETASLSGEAVLLPVWRIKTDAGSFLLNEIDGELESIEPLL